MIQRILFNDDIGEIAKVLNRSFATVADDFAYNKENVPTNAAFMTEHGFLEMLKGREFYKLTEGEETVGVVGIEKSPREEDTYFIEKLAVLPEHRHKGLGLQLMQFAENRIRELGGEKVSVSLIEEHKMLKQWYAGQGYRETLVRKFDHLPFTVCFMEKIL